MSLRSEPLASRRDTVLFLGCLVLSVAAQIAPPHITDPIASGLRNTLLAPFLSLQSSVERTRRVRRDFERLQAERDSAIAMVDEVAALRRANERLLSILGLGSRMPVRFVAGDVLHQLQPTDPMTLLVSVGARAGVRRWAPVVALGGLLGNVQVVSGETAVVHTWLHPEFAVSVTALNDSVVGLVVPRQGDGRGTTLELRDVYFDGEIPLGTPVFTSGVGGVYPAGIPVGSVRGSLEESTGWSRSFRLQPAVHPASVGHVLILLAEVNDLSPAFVP